MLKESSKKLEGNDRYEGFGIEIIEELAKMNEFNYTFDIQTDGVYGSYDAKIGKWTGMMEKIMDGVNNISTHYSHKLFTERNILIKQLISEDYFHQNIIS